MRARYRGTTLERQELDGVLTLDTPDALFSRRLIAACHGGEAPSRRSFTRMVIGVDPAIGGRDETGIITVGRSVEKIMPQISTKTHAGRI